MSVIICSSNIERLQPQECKIQYHLKKSATVLARTGVSGSRSISCFHAPSIYNLLIGGTLLSYFCESAKHLHGSLVCTPKFAKDRIPRVLPILGPDSPWASFLVQLFHHTNCKDISASWDGKRTPKMVPTSSNNAFKSRLDSHSVSRSF